MHRDWVQVGDRHHHPSKSHVQECGGYPPWGDDSDNRTYGEPTWNYIYVSLYTTAVLPAVVVDTDVIAAGVESGAIPDAAITASSTYGPQCAPPTARLAYNAKKDDLRIFVYYCDEPA